MRLAKTTVAYFLAQVGKSLAGFVATLYIARVLGPTPLGQYAVVLALSFWLALPAGAISSAIKKRVSEGTDQAEYLWTGVGMSVTIALLFAVVIVAFRPYVNDYIGTDVALLLGVLIVSKSLFQTTSTGLHGLRMVAKGGYTQFIERLLRTGLQIFLIWLSFEVFGLVLGHILSLAAATVVAVLWSTVGVSLPSVDHAKDLYSYAKYAWLSSLKGRAFSWIDTIVLALFVSSSLIGIYEVAWSLASMFALVSISIHQTLFPEFSDLETDGNFDQIHHYLNEGLVFIGVFAIPGLFGGTVIGSRVLEIYGSEFSKGSLVLVVLIAARLLAAYEQQFLSVINAIDRPDVAFRINGLFVVANVSLNLGLVYLYSWIGAAVATLISVVITTVAGYIALTKLIGRPDVPYPEIAQEIIAALVMVGAVILIEPTAPESVAGTVALVLLGAGVYGTILVAISSRIRQKTRSVVVSLV
ncbi:polysaccharide biosynthesis C-terminal domain-containing protein [Halobellus inordinatus]|uniref:oligosaccharide flippase family protein n=1 Tax=Halobellus inordinatus TaxID=1126236 RepID=UPI00210B6B70|nr:polysaccharide biosynthesis C-terminal domain-containing protein [Halobellus inordinatus]